MKSLFIVVLLWLTFAGRAVAHDTTTTKLERLAWVTGSALGLSLFDYVGHSMTKGTAALPAYRVSQTLLHWGLTYLLYDQLGLSSAISFNLIWWTWGLDFGYYGWAYVLNPPWPFEHRGRMGLDGDHVTWAWWTPMGLLRDKDERVPLNVLVPQSLIGFSIAVAIL